MQPKLRAVLAAGLLIGAGSWVAAGGADKDEGAVREIQQANRMLNEAFARRDAATIRRLVTDDHIAITPYYGGALAMGDQLKNLADLLVPDYQASDVKVNLLTKDAALVTYSVKQKGTYKGMPVAPRNYVAAVWVNKEGKWREVSYQETPLDGGK